MTLLYPAMLIGLAGLAAPLLLHLIARQNYPTVRFAAVVFLQAKRRANVFAARFVDVPQLLLRLAAILLLVLLMARLFTSGGAQPAPANVVVVLDGSASMRARSRVLQDGQPLTIFELARQQAQVRLDGWEGPGQAALIFAGETPEVLVPLTDDPSAAQGLLEALAPIDGRGGALPLAIARACDMLRGRREAKSQVLVLTDLRRSALPEMSRIDRRALRLAAEEMGERLEITFVDLSEKAPRNVAIVEGGVRDGSAYLGEDVHMLARMRNFGAEPEEIELRLDVAGRSVPSRKRLLLEPGADAVVDLTARVTRVTSSFVRGSLKIEDDFLGDNAYLAPLRVVDFHRVLIVDGESASAAPGAEPSAFGGLAGPGEPAGAETSAGPGSALLLRYALNPKREAGLAGGSGIETTLVTPDSLAGQSLGRYGVIFLVGVESLSAQSLRDLRAFVRDGRAVVMICPETMDAMLFNKAFGAKGEESALAPCEIGVDGPCKPPAAVDMSRLEHLLVESFGRGAAGSLAPVRFVRLRQTRNLAPEAAEVLWSKDGQPLLLEMPVGKGRVVCMPFGFELSRGNLARTRAFPVLMERLARYLLGDLEKDDTDCLVSGQSAVLNVNEPSFAFLDRLTLTRLAEGGEGLALAVTENRTVDVPALQAGEYMLHKPDRPGGNVRQILYGRPVAVNVDPRESELAKAGADELQRVLGVNASILAPDEVASRHATGREWWVPLAVLLFLLYAAEAVCGYRTDLRREREQEATA